MSCSAAKKPCSSTKISLTDMAPAARHSARAARVASRVRPGTTGAVSLCNEAAAAVLRGPALGCRGGPPRPAARRRPGCPPLRLKHCHQPGEQGSRKAGRGRKGGALPPGTAANSPAGVLRARGPQGGGRAAAVAPASTGACALPSRPSLAHAPCPPTRMGFPSRACAAPS